MLLGRRGDGVRGRRRVRSSAHCSSARWRAVLAFMLPLSVSSSFCVVGETRLGARLRGLLPMVGPLRPGAARGCPGGVWWAVANGCRVRARRPWPRRRFRRRGLAAAPTTLSELGPACRSDESTDGSFSCSSMRAGRGLVLAC